MSDDDGPRQAIIEELRNGARTRGALIDWTDYHENTIQTHLGVLEAEGVVEKIHEPTALWELQEDPDDAT